MMERVKETARTAWHWFLAGLIATAIASTGLSLIFSRADKVAAHDKKPCIERPCFAQLDSRLGALEAAMLVRTANRYTSQDAERDNRIMLSAIQKQAKEIAVLRAQLEQKN